jgi:diamine N-acetyltransferase
MEISIRESRLEDAGALIELRRQIDDVHAEARPDLFVSADFYTEDDIKAYFDAEKSKVFVAEEAGAGKILAYMILNTEPSPQLPIFKHPRTFVYINDFCVAAQYRRRGIGKALMEYAIAYAKGINADTLELNVAEFNLDAIRLYESMGMTTRNRRMELWLK